MKSVTLQRPPLCARAGLKGPRAVAWLAERGITVPAAPNRWAVVTAPSPAPGENWSAPRQMLPGLGEEPGAPGQMLPGSGEEPRAPGQMPVSGEAIPAAGETTPCSGEELLVARLGFGEFFLEDSPGGTMLARWDTALQASAGVYPVLREDAALVLAGEGALDVLAQICSVNFSELALPERPVIMTQMVGVSVLVVAHGAAVAKDTAISGGAAEVRYRIWCDPTFGEYLERTIGAIVVESGGNHRGAA